MIEERAFESWDHFKRDFAHSLVKDGPLIETYVFRGQGDAKWVLESSFDRMCPVSVEDRQAYYRKMLAFFCYQIRQYGEDLDARSWEDRAAIAQHYGMPTRLIDWSRSPYVAAFMAFYSALTEGRCKPGARVAIWVLNQKRFQQLVPEPEAPFRTVRTRLLENDRVWRQAGLFIEARDAASKLDAYLLERAGPEDSGLMKYTLPALQAEAALNDLILMGLTPATIYPDRDGAAKYVRLRMALDP